MTKNIVLVIGVLLLLAGVLGFFGSPVLGMFEVDMLHNIVHIATGALALVFALKGEQTAKTFAKVFGVIYAVVAIAGLTLSADGKILGILTANMNDHVLHILLALVLLAIGFMKGSSASSATSTPSTQPPMGGGMAM